MSKMAAVFLCCMVSLGVWAADGPETPLPKGDEARLKTLTSYVEDMAPQGFTQTGSIETYSTINLYDKIDGRSELYNSYDVVGLAFVSFALDSAPEKFIDIFLYDMRTPLGAFGAFSVERWSDSKPLELGQGGYRTEKDHFFWSGDFYATILGAGDSAEIQQGCVEIGKKLAARLPKATELPWGFEYFDKNGLEPDSIQYFSIDGLSLDFLLRTFTARYARDGFEYQAYIAQQDSPEAAQSVREQFADYLKSYGSNVTETEVDGAAVIYGDTGGGYYDGVFVSGEYVAGFSALTKIDHVAEIVTQLRASLKGK